MKLIDLLNKIAKGEEVPKKIKVSDEIYIFSNDDGDYYNVIDGKNSLLEKIWRYNAYIWLNLKVEIIEEEQEIEKLPLPSFEEFKNMSAEERYLVTAKEYDVLHQIIDEVNKLKRNNND